MPLLSYNAAPAKGASRTATLSKSNLLALAPVAADAYWAEANNTKKVIITIKSTVGKQKRVLQLNFTQSSPQAALAFPQYCRDDFEISKIVMIDFLGDKLTILGSEVDLSADDISLAVVPVPALTIISTGAAAENGVLTISATVSDNYIGNGISASFYEVYEGAVISSINDLYDTNKAWKLEPDVMGTASSIEFLPISLIPAGSTYPPNYVFRFGVVVSDQPGNSTYSLFNFTIASTTAPSITSFNINVNNNFYLGPVFELTTISAYDINTPKYFSFLKNLTAKLYLVPGPVTSVAQAEAGQDITPLITGFTSEFIELFPEGFDVYGAVPNGNYNVNYSSGSGHSVINYFPVLNQQYHYVLVVSDPFGNKTFQNKMVVKTE